jgi:hypothetical protein
VAIVIDERDQAALADQEGDDECGITIEHVNVTRRVCIVVMRQSLCVLNQLLGSIAYH